MGTDETDGPLEAWWSAWYQCSCAEVRCPHARAVESAIRAPLEAKIAAQNQLLAAAYRCDEPDIVIVSVYEALDREWAENARLRAPQAQPTIEPASAPPNPILNSDSGSTSITTLASRETREP